MSIGYQLLGQYLTLEEICTCTQTYRRFADQIDPYPTNLDETIPALAALCQHIIDPVIDAFGRERFQLTYGFCSSGFEAVAGEERPSDRDEAWPGEPESGSAHGP
jgi:hypothetical protein